MNVKKLLLSCKMACLFLLLLLAVAMSSANAQTLHPLGAQLLSETEYEQLPKVNWDVLKSNANTQTILRSSGGIVMLNNPPVGDQGSQGSCVGWAVGYAAVGILDYPKFNNWNDARRSPNYVYNQIKITNDCLSGTYTSYALNLVKNQGVCSYILMPYVNNDCMTLPNELQISDASANKVLSWSTLSKNNVSDIKQAIDLGYPVVAVFQVYTSFENMWNSGGVWSTTNTGIFLGSHATCIIGYDDTKQMFKVQNSWGTSGGDNGYFWVTYNLVQNNCLSEVYVLSGITPCVNNDYTNQTVTTSTTVNGCTNLNVQNVTVSNNAKLTLNAPGDVTVNGSFEVQLGSELQIK